jgi:predicted nucleic acid-binding protein
MVLVDTSVWAGHLRSVDSRLSAALSEGIVLAHPLVIEEVACGSLRNRDEVLDLLNRLPKASVASHQEVLDFNRKERLYGTGVGAIDIHIMASARLMGAKVWSQDKALCRQAQRLGILAAPY